MSLDGTVGGFNEGSGKSNGKGKHSGQGQPIEKKRVMVKVSSYKPDACHYRSSDKGVIRSSVNSRADSIAQQSYFS